MKAKIIVVTILFFINFVSASSQTRDKIDLLFCKSDLVVLAEVKDVVKIKYGVWNGGLIVSQPVTYKIQKIYKGSFENAEIIVQHPIIYGSKTADKKIPRLSPVLFKEGSQLIVFIEYIKPQKSPDYYSTFNSDYGVLKPNSMLFNRLDFNITMLRAKENR